MEHLPITLPTPLYTEAEEQAFLAEIYSEWPDEPLSEAAVDELARLDACNGRPHEL